MQTTFKGLRTCIYKVPDVAAAAQWYKKALGTEPYFNQAFYVGFNVAGYELGLQPGGEDNTTATSTITYWGVDDVQRAFDVLIAIGATAYEQPQDVGDGIVVASVKDPWGNAFGIIYNPHFKVQ